jgi:hypothetical protein
MAWWRVSFCVVLLVGIVALADPAAAVAVIDCNAINSGAIGATLVNPSNFSSGPISLNVGDRLDFTGGRQRT